MDPQIVQSIVEEVVLRLKRAGQTTPGIPIGVSARHAHVSIEHLETLFGAGYELTQKSDLFQPGQFAANETVLIVGPKGSIENVRILGPVRGATQVEISRTDAMKLGYQPPLRESGDVQGSSPVTIVGPKGSLYLTEGLIIAQRHIHMSPQDAKMYGFKQGEDVLVQIAGPRSIVYDNVRIRVSERYKLEMHMDTDEANAAWLATGDTGIILHPSDSKWMRQTTELDEQLAEPARRNRGYQENVQLIEQKLLTQRDIQELDASTITVSKHTIITPLARDTAKDKGITILFKQS
ncbi:phosphate propanoyltransferase [Paenibacillus qinlingensis]|uniref:Phosphate propanoyltransferase n=1 Tax=Paenibacillus qinlingensis TaxID=1837343 RepID=A0ABU1NT92_9BACL|nr:phosphate propanoyltransferase [Paenibacillus qinlingensis]MDR6550564.1 putative phosphotransacetylase [Paenibacillus qinlingensis]